MEVKSADLAWQKGVLDPITELANKLLDDTQAPARLGAALISSGAVLLLKHDMPVEQIEKLFKRVLHMAQVALDQISKRGHS